MHEWSTAWCARECGAADFAHPRCQRQPTYPACRGAPRSVLLSRAISSDGSGTARARTGQCLCRTPGQAGSAGRRPIALWGFTGREEASQTYIFEQEENFNYLTGHNEEGAALVILPAAKAGSEYKAEPRESLYLPVKNPLKEKWNGARMSPADPGIEARTGFASVKPFAELRATVEGLAKSHANFYTILPYEKELGGYPHEKEVVDWLQQVAPQAKLKDIRVQIGAMRQIKSPGEIAFLKQAIELSLDSQLAAMRMMRPGLYEYQVAAKMVEVHAMGGSEAEAYAPIVGAGPNSTALHYDRLSRKIEDGDIVVLDVGAHFSGYSADITRTLPANGKFTPRQLEIYNIVLGAQNAALGALKP